MLDIDYSLVLMTEEDEALVRQEVNQRIEIGDIPPQDRKVDGRVVVLNPDPVQTVHQISDDLRPRLRRIMMPAQEGSTHLSAERLYKDITESDERLYLIIIELQSEFRSLSKFIEFLPRLRRDYPELAVYLSGSMTHLRGKLHQLLAEDGDRLVVEYPGDRPSVEISDPNEFMERVTTQEQVVALSVPFFTEIRLVVEAGGKPLAFNLLSLRKLQSVLGHGEPQEVEVGKGRKERMIIIDLPMPLIHDFRFRQDRGLEFLGAVINGNKVSSRHFNDEKLEFRWIPMKSVDAFLRRNPAAEEEEIRMEQVNVLRVNTLTGQVSFVMKQEENRVALEQAKVLGFTKKITGAAAKGLEGVEGLEDGEMMVAFDRFIQPGNYSGGDSPMQAEVKAHFYHKLIGEEVEQGRKLEIYAQRLKVAAVGPLAGQTLKLLRRFGLERLIDPESFYYLCDTPEEVMDFRDTTQRYGDHFQGLVTMIGDLAVGKPSKTIRISDIAFNLPISTEWVDAKLATFDRVTHQELEAVFHEMHLLLNFITHEFRRSFDISSEDAIFFEKIQHCREAALLAKWLSEFKRGAYGEPMPGDMQPDVVFYASEADKKENDTRYFFPSMSCTELFREPANKELFSEFDFDFSVFLEEQLALAIHHAREKGVMEPGTADFQAYFQEKTGEDRKELDELNEMLEAIDNTGSDIYKRMLKQEEENYRQRYTMFMQDQEKAIQGLEAVTHTLDKLLAELKEHLDRAGAVEVEFYLKNPENPDAREQRILEAAERSEQSHAHHLNERFGDLRAEIERWVTALEQMAVTMEEIHSLDVARYEAQVESAQLAMAEQWAERQAGRMEILRKMKNMEREHHTRRVEGQLTNLQGEMGPVEQKLAQFNAGHKRAVGMLNHYLAHAGLRLEALGQVETLEDPRKVVAQGEALRKSLVEISRNALKLAKRSGQLQENLDRLRLRRQRDLKQINHLKMELAMLEAVTLKAETPVAPFAPALGSPPEPGAWESLTGAWKSERSRLGEVGRAIRDTAADVETALKAVRGQAAIHLRFKANREDLIRQIARKRRLRQSVDSLAERKTIMETEMADLPERVKTMFMPARKKLLMDVFIPEQERKIGNYTKVVSFINDLMGLPHEQLKERFLDHAVYRRFYFRQFVRGGGYAPDPASSLLLNTMRNVAPSLLMLNRALIHNFKINTLPGTERVTLPQLGYQDPQSLLGILEGMSKVTGALQFNYLVLPPTLSLLEGLNIINRKDAWFNGVPRLVLIFITKFERKLLRSDSSVREAYFKAVRHNIVINIDGHEVVDNPRSIGMRLLQDTLGCAIDLPHVEEPPGLAASAATE